MVLNLLIDKTRSLNKSILSIWKNHTDRLKKAIKTFRFKLIRTGADNHPGSKDDFCSRIARTRPYLEKNAMNCGKVQQYSKKVLLIFLICNTIIVILQICTSTCLFQVVDHHKPNDFVTFSYKLIICLSNGKFNRNVMPVYASFSAIL